MYVPNLKTTTPKKSCRFQENIDPWSLLTRFNTLGTLFLFWANTKLLNTQNFMSIATNEHDFKVSMKFSKYLFDLGKDQI